MCQMFIVTILQNYISFWQILDLPSPNWNNWQMRERAKSSGKGMALPSRPERPRKMVISGIDQEETSKLNRKAARKLISNKWRSRRPMRAQVKPILPVVPKTTQTVTRTQTVPLLMSIFQNQSGLRQRGIASVKKWQPLLTTACDWTGLSDRLAAILTTSVLHDLTVVSPINPSK